MKATKICKNRSDKKILNHDLKNQEVCLLDNDSNAKGQISIKTLIITNLKAYERARFKKPIETNPLIRPSKEKIFIPVSSKYIVELKSSTNLLKQISVLNKFSPTSLIERDIKETIFISCSQQNDEKLSKTTHNKSLKINWVGFSELEKTTKESKEWIA